jgi:hypothetical protein
MSISRDEARMKRCLEMMSSSSVTVRGLDRKVRVRRNSCKSHLPIGKDTVSTLKRYKFYDQCELEGFKARGIKSETERAIMKLTRTRREMGNTGIFEEEVLQIYDRDIKKLRNAFVKYVIECNHIFGRIRKFSRDNDRKTIWTCIIMHIHLPLV